MGKVYAPPPSFISPLFLPLSPIPRQALEAAGKADEGPRGVQQSLWTLTSEQVPSHTPKIWGPLDLI